MGLIAISGWGALALALYLLYRIFMNVCAPSMKLGFDRRAGRKCGMTDDDIRLMGRSRLIAPEHESTPTDPDPPTTLHVVAADDDPPPMAASP